MMDVPLKLRIGVIMYQTSRSKGQELVAQRMVRYFRRLGHEAYLITSVYHDGKEAVSDELIGETGYVQADDAELGIPIIRVGSLTSKWPPRRLLFKDPIHTLERIVNNFQLTVFITHSTLWNGPEEVAKFVEWRRNIRELGGPQAPLIFCHMSHFQEPSPGGYSLVERSFRIAWNRLSLRTILRVANLILVVTPYEEEAKIKLGAPKEKFVLFPGGVDDDEFLSFSSTNPGEFLERFHLPREAKIVAYMGTLEERKNPMAVVEVADRLKDRNDIRFVIAGAGDSEYAKEVKRKADALPNITWVGEVSEKEKVQLIKNSYINILLSRMEALGLTQLEFMFQGVPVVTSGVGGQAWIVRDGREGIHVKGHGDIEGAARAVVELVDNRGTWEKYSTNARKRATEFTLTKLIQKLDQAITKEIEKETGLVELPPEVRSTLSEPQTVLRTWSHGSQKVVASDKSVFIQEGRISRNTYEVSYSSIGAIEYIREYRWGTLLLGVFLSLVLLTQHYIFPVVSRSLTSRLVLLLIGLMPALRPSILQTVRILWLLPISAASLFFAANLRKGYALHGTRMNPIFLSPSFREAVEYIRQMRGGPPPVRIEKTQTDDFTASG
jgi:D-inositol-3-phosphate glycosyltransferase